MDWLAILRRSGGIDALARQIGQPPASVLAGADALLPSLLAGLATYVQNQGGGEAGMRALVDMIDGLGDGSLAIAVMNPGPLDIATGEAILDQVLGSAAAIRKVTDDAADLGGFDAGVLARMLPVFTMLMSGYISARAQTGEALDWLRDGLELRGRPGRRRNGLRR